MTDAILDASQALLEPGFVALQEPSGLKIKDGRLKRLLAENRPNKEMVEELFLATLSRSPDAGDKQTALDHVRNAAHRKAAYVDIVWALINTREFILNH